MGEGRNRPDAPLIVLAGVIHRFSLLRAAGAGMTRRARGTRLRVGPRRRTHAVRSVPRFIDMVMFADGACEARSRSEEKAIQGHRRRRVTRRSPATPISPKGGGGTASISLSLLLRDAPDIASSSLRELDAVALATNATVSMKRGTKKPKEAQRSQRG
jgi:hypothetical protein